MNFYSVRLRSSFFFLSLQEGTAFGDPGRPIQTDSTASGISRQRETETEREKERTQRVSSSLSLSLKNGHVHLDQLSRNDSIVSRMCINPSNTIQKFFIRPFPYDFTILCEYNETDFFKRKDANFSSFRV